MRRYLIFAALVLSLLATSRCLSQEPGQLSHGNKIYITSFFDCPVYWGNKRVTILKKGTRAELISSTNKWFLVRFWSGRKYISGWIKR